MIDLSAAAGAQNRRCVTPTGIGHRASFDIQPSCLALLLLVTAFVEPLRVAIGAAGGDRHSKEKPAAVARRFETTVARLEDRGVPSPCLHTNNETRDVAFSNKRLDGSLALNLPRTGQGSISFNYGFFAEDTSNVTAKP